MVEFGCGLFLGIIIGAAMTAAYIRGQTDYCRKGLFKTIAKTNFRKEAHNDMP